ncbi:MAG: metal ABC transporter ATP-binding protein [Clostridia bacterium]|nr:metal ABC transporter ATP-binding protein [Clostridia bacterium]
MNIIEVSNLSAFYESRQVFKNLDFVVKEGDYLCIIGENGSGKTTLMKILLGLGIKHTGTIKLTGFTKREIGWLPQKTQHQKDFPASVKEVVMSGFDGPGFFGFKYSRHQKDLAKKNMKLLDIEGIAEKSFSELSGGQQQKVLLCRALCAAKKVLLLDEAVTGLDDTSSDELYSLIKKLNNQGLAIVMITHDTKRALADAKHILSLSENAHFYGKVTDFNMQSKGGVE